MIKPIYSSEEHKSITDIYLLMCKQFVEEATTQRRYKNYLEVVNIITEYHNGYGSGLKENNFYDWLMIIPINLSVATSGFFAGIETKSNSAVIRAYRVVLDQMMQETCDKLDSLQIKND
tara:strand:+ start:3495 stop:3851 length:357 start_codon:yes stop_codon:yes gene_type:complete